MRFATAVAREKGIIGPDELLTRAQYTVLEYMFTPAPGESKVMEMFRGLGKTTMGELAIITLLHENPRLKFLVVSASNEFAKKVSFFILDCIRKIPWLHMLRPDTKDGRYSVTGWDVGNCPLVETSPSLSVCGVNGQLPGVRADYILADDIETDKTALSMVSRQTLWNAINEFVAIFKPGRSEVWYLGTKHSQTESIYPKLHRERNARMLIWPARVPASTTPYFGQLAPYVRELVERGGMTGQPTDARFDDEELLRREMGMSPLGWQMQYMLDATLSDESRFPLKIRNLMVLTIDDHVPEVMTYMLRRENQVDGLQSVGLFNDNCWYHPHETSGRVPVAEVQSVMVLDPSGGGSDEFAYCVIYAWAGNYFLVHMNGTKAEAGPEFFRQMAMDAKRFKVKQIVVETNFAGLEVYQQILKPHLIEAGHLCSIEPYRSSGRKEQRIIDTLAPLTQQHRVGVDRRVIEEDMMIVVNSKEDSELAYSLFYQFSRLTNERNCLSHDDRLDVFAIGCEWFQLQASEIQEQRQQKRSHELMMASLPDPEGRTLLTLERRLRGFTLEQAREAERGAPRPRRSNSRPRGVRLRR